VARRERMRPSVVTRLSVAIRVWRARASSKSATANASANSRGRRFLVDLDHAAGAHRAARGAAHGRARPRRRPLQRERRHDARGCSSAPRRARSVHCGVGGVERELAPARRSGSRWAATPALSKPALVHLDEHRRQIFAGHGSSSGDFQGAQRSRTCIAPDVDDTDYTLSSETVRYSLISQPVTCSSSRNHSSRLTRSSRRGPLAPCRAPRAERSCSSSPTASRRLAGSAASRVLSSSMDFVEVLRVRLAVEPFSIPTRPRARPSRRGTGSPSRRSCGLRPGREPEHLRPVVVAVRDPDRRPRRAARRRAQLQALVRVDRAP
jgi:hypothetical protein